ncbi:hypothetical protein VA7868_01352 [Vibrio aerogenes CECT 7868]|uniref:Uncharacterized protein n=1 Tax=Vibrio aerogenes CECT 7868 TaxID=1216006 RepID=A0A1M5XWM5_9VIBR|nr:hypothetical protein [Vibrio aerogenes]SHI03964.1 hypothetical protein VA7868_01352 [Vibrio aerogenes CECT 7868]
MSSIIESEMRVSEERQNTHQADKLTLRDIATLFSMFAVTATISLLTTLSWVA